MNDTIREYLSKILDKPVEKITEADALKFIEAMATGKVSKSIL